MLSFKRGQSRLLAAARASTLRAGSQGIRRAATPLLATRNSSSLSGPYVDEMYVKWKGDRASVHPSWDVYFQKNVPTATQASVLASGSSAAGRVVSLIRAYQVRGHEKAKLDPLAITQTDYMPELDVATYGYTEADLDTPLGMGEKDLQSISGVLQDMNEDTTLRQVLHVLESVYCGPIGYEFMHIPERTKCNWLREKIERITPPRSKEWRYQVLERLTFSERFEAFVANKWNTKRFGIEGCESLTVGLKTAVDVSVQAGVEEVVMGMAHRGRLNVLVNVLRKPLVQMFKEFAGTQQHLGEEWEASGDVKYHLGTSMDRTYPDGKTVHLSMLANPSHLEAVNAVVCGKARAKMMGHKDTVGKKIMPVIIHGDAAFAGQGVCYEQMQLAQLPDFYTGGTYHVVCNNQIGFTTDPSDSRSTKYCSDIAKAFNAPVFHVNADHAEAVAEVFALAAEWRAEFHTDVVIDLIGYRKHGHNELDQPSFTQPLMYSVISKHPSPLKLHSQRLIEAGAFSQAEIDDCIKLVDSVMEDEYAKSKLDTEKQDVWLCSRWAGFKAPHQFSEVKKTGEEMQMLEHVAAYLTKTPADFTMHRQIKKVYDLRGKALAAKHGLDWAAAEALAFGCLLQSGTHVRLTGQDAQRGTFSHRHARVHCQKTGDSFMPLANIPGNRADISIINSPLSEYGVLAFEHGYSLEDPNNLVIWEAQFGDFYNGAQIVIDQFISSGEKKWLRQSGLVLLLPHGYDGGGPDHSSCRLERFLQQCDEDADTVPEMAEQRRMQIQRANWQIVNCTTPANYFHALQRQQKREFRKPLIVVSPKNMLKMKECTSTLEEMGVGSIFQRAIPEVCPEEICAPEDVRRLVLCSGKVYYELRSNRRKNEVKDVAIGRIEQIHPFPFDKVAEMCATYPNAEVVWMQEEPKNMGCWQFVQDRILTANKVLNKRTVKPSYVGRSTMASTAEGYGAIHARTQAALLDMAMSDQVHNRFHGEE